jgi:protein phosphatase
MRAGRVAAATDTGRKRLRNEDAFVCDPPLFLVADGMGGARGGELAARIATSVFEGDRTSPELDAVTRLRALVLEANRQVFERASSEPDLAGMGTTLTVALLEDDRVAIAHVGDSRAYRLRDGRLEQLTDDHSLVGELVRAGRLTPDEAELHPQRSVITRAVGTDPTVLADLFLAEARAGDVFLLCTDGLSALVDPDAIARTIIEAGSPDDAARALVRAANQAGGDDNVTVVLFDVEQDARAGAREAEPPDGDDPTTDDHTLAGLPLRASTPPATSRLPPAPPPTAYARSLPVGAWRPRRVALVFGLVLALVAAAVAGAVWFVKRSHFVGATEDGHVAIYEGLPWELGGGVSLYREIYVSPLLAAQLEPAERAQLFDHSLVSEARARALLAPYEDEVARP